MAERVYAVGSGSRWDERRNTSQALIDPNALRDALRVLNAGRHEPWYAWIVKRQRGEHDHEALRVDGRRAACPVLGCEAELSPTSVDEAKRARLAARG